MRIATSFDVLARGPVQVGGRGPQATLQSGETVARSSDTPTHTRCSGHKRDLMDLSPALFGRCNGLMTRSLNDLTRARFQPCKPSHLKPRARHLHRVQTVTSVTIRPPIPTPTQWVIRISTETDDLTKSGSARASHHSRSTRETGGPWPCRAGGRHPAQRLHAGDTVETKRAAHRFSAIKMRSLNDPRHARFQPFNPHRRIRHHPPANSDSCSTG
jgi:hypothetical protein